MRQAYGRGGATEGGHKTKKQPHSPAVLPCMGHTSIKPEAPGTHRVLGQDTLRAALETAAVAGVHLCYLGRGAHQEPTLQKWSQERKRATSSRPDHELATDSVLPNPGSSDSQLTWYSFMLSTGCGSGNKARSSRTLS